MAISVRLPADLHERLRARAYADRTSANQIITYALLEYLDDEPVQTVITGPMFSGNRFAEVDDDEH